MVKVFGKPAQLCRLLRFGCISGTYPLPTILLTGSDFVRLSLVGSVPQQSSLPIGGEYIYEVWIVSSTGNSSLPDTTLSPMDLSQRYITRSVTIITDQCNYHEQLLFALLPVDRRIRQRTFVEGL
jgi:hypothetical protein